MGSGCCMEGKHYGLVGHQGFRCGAGVPAWSGGRVIDDLEQEEQTQEQEQEQEQHQQQRRQQQQQQHPGSWILS